MEKIKKLVIVSGYFNPLHKGHVEYLERSKKLGDKLAVIINNDLQVELKGSVKFQSEDERKLIIEALRCVDYAFISVDNSRDVSKTLRCVCINLEADNYIFANGGDQTATTILESDVCDELEIELVFGLGDKIQSSSELKKKL
jgi:cytidyltransferase-like protein